MTKERDHGGKQGNRRLTTKPFRKNAMSQPFTPPFETQKNGLSASWSGTGRSDRSHLKSPRHTSCSPQPLQVEQIEAAHREPSKGPVHIPRCVLHPPMLHPIVGVLFEDKAKSFPSKNCTDCSFDDRARSFILKSVQDTQPPVTIEHLQELELQSIQNTLSLRVDLIFDDLYFQRLSGSKAAEKQKKARIFYECLAMELKAIQHMRQGPCKHCHGSRPGRSYSIPSRLHSFFATLRDLLELLVPETEKADVGQMIDPEWLTRMVRVGQFDAISFAKWLCTLIVRHCAPMRDDMARQMRDSIIEGAEQGDMDLLVEGLETLLILLENMKIDVANHQVRSFKLLLVADTVPFLQDCFSKMIENGQFQILESQRWYLKLRKQESAVQLNNFGVFAEGVVKLASSKKALIPPTFGYDKERFKTLRNDIHDANQLEVCKKLYRDLYFDRFHRCPSHDQTQGVAKRIVDLLTSDEDGVHEALEDHIEEVALEISRAATASHVGDYISHRALSTTQIDDATKRLHGLLCSPNWISAIESKTFRQVQERVSFHTARFRCMETLQLSNSQRLWSTQQSSRSGVSLPDLEDIARRIAHITVVHWQVWSDLVYLNVQGSGASTASPISGVDNNSFVSRHKEIGSGYDSRLGSGFKVGSDSDCGSGPGTGSNTESNSDIDMSDVDF